MAVDIDAVYQGELACRATHGLSGRSLDTDASPEDGGHGRSFSPTDLVAAALGTCVLTILGLVTERHGVDLAGTRVRVEGHLATKPTRRIASLETVVTLPADVAITETMRQRLEAAVRKCPVHQSLHDSVDAPITFRHE